MTSISSLSSYSPQSPLDRLKEELESEVSAGTISSTDESALSDALDSIDQSLQTEASSGTKASPEDMQDKINSLIDEQVKSGTLTEDQATELKQVFENAKPQGGAGGPPPPPSGGGSSEDATSSTSDTSSTTTDAAELLKTFLEALKNQSTTTGYGNDGSGTSSSISALVLDTAA